MNKYAMFVAMIATATLVMFGMMYLNTCEPSHLYFSQTRAWMAVLMGAAISLIMLGFMLHMYPSRRANLGIVAGGVIAFGVGLWLVRSLSTLGVDSWMKSMIPHHSIAVLTSKRARPAGLARFALAGKVA